jgi:nitrogen fixation protein NifZ
MSDPGAPLFAWGQAVQSATQLLNDGSYPDWPEDAPLVQRGERGEVVQVGLHVESNTRIYLVEFSRNRVVGCLETELAPWSPPAPAPSQESQTA